MSPVLNTLEAAYLLEAGRRDEARARLNRALDIAPGFWLAHCTQGLLDLADQQPDNAIAEMRRGVELADGNPTAALLGMYLARLGQTEEAREILSQLLTLAKSRYVSPSSIAAVHAALGEVELALDALDQAFVTRDTRLTFPEGRSAPGQLAPRAALRRPHAQAEARPVRSRIGADLRSDRAGFPKALPRDGVRLGVGRRRLSTVLRRNAVRHRARYREPVAGAGRDSRRGPTRSS